MRTPIDTLREKYFKTGMLYETDFNEAKAMHKEEIIDAVNFGDERGKITTYLTAEQYYNEAFRGSNSEIPNLS